MVSEKELNQTIIMYKRAGLSEKQILEKIEKKFGSKNIKVVSEQLKKEKNERFGLEKKKFLLISFGIITTLLILSIFFYIIFVQYSQFSSENCSGIISISGAYSSRQRAYEILEYVEKDCEYYEFVSEHLTRLEVDFSKGLFSGGYYSGGESAEINVFNSSTEYMASIVVHEACHAFQLKNNLFMSEPDCTLTQYNYLKNVGASQEELQKVIDLKKWFPKYAFSENDNDIFELWKKQK
jgi:hypothetical protein